MPKVVLCFLIICCAGCLQEVSAPVRPQGMKQNRIIVKRNTMISSRYRNNPIVEPHLSAHPLKSQHLLASAMVVTNPDRPYESCRLSSFVSTDGGENWTETEHDYWGYDPWAVITVDGRTVMTWIGTKAEFRDEYPIVFFASDDGGLVWKKDVQILPGNHDGTKLIVSTNGVYFTTIYFEGHMDTDLRVYWSNFKEPFRLKASIDGNGEHLNFAEPAVLSNGTLVLPISVYKKFAWVQTSNDQGATFSQPYRITEKLGEGKGYSHLVADSSNSRFKDRLYFVRAAGYGETFEGIFINYSKDSGKTWSEDQRIDLFEGQKRSGSMVPTLAVNRDGVVGISWMDSQSDVEPGKKDLYFTISTDGGVTFQRPVRITDVSSNPNTSANADVANKFPGGGHYLGLVARADGSFQAIWSDSRNGLFQLQTCNILIKD